ncbi:uncharacterized protein LOC111600587 isoform X2 [Drosophila hydei]|uniref:Uncharacterized protein LOC111600587 isoform X2 n=1 Tax=Drosophila hydei TaxID=7224 RepID=A0A6J1M6P3_DROHY|nr:uncharacterized protein LOC111600587 isoform X2 [Drosophila hydei]
MFGSRRHLLLLVCLSALFCLSLAELAETEVIKDDVIEIANKTQKVIRVSPLELPSKEDRTPGSHMNSELFQIQTLQRGAKHPRQRLYMDSRRMRSRPRISESSEAEKKAAEAAALPTRA